jgi:PAS domain S-box-containing protein
MGQTHVENELRRANRALRVLGECNRAVVRATEEPALLGGICRILIESGGYRLAWVGFAEQDEAMTVRPVAQWGYEEGYLDTARITWADTGRGRGPTGTAIRTGRPAVARNLLVDPAFAPWRAEATRRGYASSLALPLTTEGRTLGALNIYAAEPDAFDAEEVKLLTELASDVASGILSLRARAAHQRAMAQLRLQAAVLEAAANAILITDATGCILWVNPAFSRLTGYTAAEALGQTPRLLKSGRQESGTYEKLWATILAGHVWRGDLVNRRKDGSLYAGEQTITPVRDAEGAISHFIAVKQDVTARKQAEETLRTRTLQLEAMRAISAEITRELDLPALLALIHWRAADLVGGVSGAVYLWEEGAELLVPGAWHGVGDWFREVRLHPGGGVAGRVAQQRRGMIVNDFRTAPFALPLLLERTGITAVIAEPLLYRGRLVGVITVNRESAERPFTEEDRDLLALFAGQAAIAIENARAHAAALRRAAELAALLRASRSIMAGLDLQQILERIVAEVGPIAGAPHVKVLLVDQAAQALRVHAVSGTGMAKGFEFPLGTGLSGWVATTGQPLFVPDCHLDARNVFAEQDRALGIQTYLGLPIKGRNGVLGVLTFSTAEPRRYTAEEVAYLSSFAGQAAVALENAGLYQAARDRAAELETLREIDRAITSQLELPAVLEAVVAGALRLLGSQFAQVILWDEASQSLGYGAASGPETERVRTQRFELGRGINGVVAQSRQPMLLDDYQASPYVVPECSDVVATITVPILFGGRLLGVLHSHTTRAGKRFTLDDLRRLQTLASQAAIAMEHARLYQELRQAAHILEARVEERTRDLQRVNAQLETAMREVEAASRHKSEFLANMSHEIRTPLNSIIGFADLLLEQTIGPLTDKQARYLGHVANSGTHLLHLVSDILDLSKVEAGKFVLQPEVLPVASVLEDILVIARGLANTKRQAVEAQIESGLPSLRADPVRLKQILFNLLSNAVKFTPEQGQIGLSARRLPTDDAYLELRVTDTGVGIRPEDLSRLFEEFVQLETTRGQRHEGTGLGLALSKRLVELHGGRIWAESDGEGKGSTFTVLLSFEGPEVGRGPDTAARRLGTQWPTPGAPSKIPEAEG